MSTDPIFLNEKYYITYEPTIFLVLISLEEDSKFHYDPFSGVRAEAIDSIIVPQIDIAEIKKLICNDSPILIEFLGKRGRGKTTHLQ